MKRSPWWLPMLLAACDREPVHVAEASDVDARASLAAPGPAQLLEQPGTETRANGLVVHTRVVGHGARAQNGDRLLIHYTGRYLAASAPEPEAEPKPEEPEGPEGPETVETSETAETVETSETPETRGNAADEAAAIEADEAPGATTDDAAPPASPEPVVFASTWKGGVPFRLTLGAGQVVRGLDLGLVGARAGSELSIEVPPALGYGAEGMGPIPPASELAFDVRVIRVER